MANFGKDQKIFLDPFGENNESTRKIANFPSGMCCHALLEFCVGTPKTRSRRRPPEFWSWLYMSRQLSSKEFKV